MVDALKIVKFEFKNINLVKIQVKIRISVPMSAYQKNGKIQNSKNNGNNNEISMKSEWNYDKMINFRFVYLDQNWKIPKKVCLLTFCFFLRLARGMFANIFVLIISEK